MLRYLADENFNGAIVRGLRVKHPQIDLVCVQEVGLSGEPDDVVLEWAARHGRVVLTHDVNTMPSFAYTRLESRLSMPGIVEVKRTLRMSHVIDDLIVIAECSLEDEHEGQVIYLPLQREVS